MFHFLLFAYFQKIHFTLRRNADNWWRHTPVPCCSDGGWLRQVAVDLQAVRFSHSYEGSLLRRSLTLPWRCQGSPGVWCVCPNALLEGTWECIKPCGEASMTRTGSPRAAESSAHRELTWWRQELLRRCRRGLVLSCWSNCSCRR